MKFSNGCWMQKEGTDIFTPAQVYFTTVKKEEVTLCAPTSRINHRGDTLGGVNLTIKISTPLPEVIRVQTFHYMGVKGKAPVFDLYIDEGANLQVEDSESQIRVRSGSLSLVIQKNNWEMTYYRENENLTTTRKCYQGI